MPKKAMTLKVTSGANVAVKLQEIPEHRINVMARQLVHAVDRYFAIPGVQEDYEKWLIEYKKEKAAQNHH